MDRIYDSVHCGGSLLGPRTHTAAPTTGRAECLLLIRHPVAAGRGSSLGMHLTGVNVVVLLTSYPQFYTSVPLYFKVTIADSGTGEAIRLLPISLGTVMGGLVSGFVIKRQATPFHPCSRVTTDKQQLWPLPPGDTHIDSRLQSVLLSGIPALARHIRLAVYFVRLPNRSGFWRLVIRCLYWAHSWP